MELLLFGIYLFLAAYLAGNMLTLQMQHYGLYRFAGRTGFVHYMQANNRSAFFPSVLPALLMLLVNTILLFSRPRFMSETEAITSMALNLIALVSTFTWQRKVQGEMAATGYDEQKIKILNSTNWIRVTAFLLQAFLAVAIALMAMRG